tara:strand:- start:265 stop:681 length:417 start_codon:yes stop_codon:yes gene_type:complete
MNREYSNSKKGAIEQNSSFSSVPIDKIMELKLLGKSDRAVAKELGVAHSTVNKHFNQQLAQLSNQARKNIENFRFQQYLRFEEVIEKCFKEFNRSDFRQTQWATILTKLLAEQSKLYGLNLGSININLDQRNNTDSAR